MGKLCSTACYSIGFLALYSGVLILSGLFISGIILGSIAAPGYIKESRIRDLYTNTSCILLNYTFVTHECQRCDEESCYTYKCFDEQFFISHSIFNGTLVTSSFISYEKAVQHKQTQV
ncbi:unnamed protein product [Rotaria sp. Silwood2]|nr:unnamed protein product [Rotaria sp. Silwood2]CAF2820279.1 unnamed protein product [Rotaria sp. Silwood2]CAF3006941.1 unnamed protein product [Rotaria sp. Silwood2]CAF3240896.1 unnamed protein product [Rotaria sp. Silwood2]CAF3938219.1 unnamed protein product [Rotaria sp. Silwood2]